MWRNALRSGSTKMIHLTFRCIILHVGRNIVRKVLLTLWKKKCSIQTFWLQDFNSRAVGRIYGKVVITYCQMLPYGLSISDRKSACAKFLGNFAIGPTKNHGICYGIHRKYHNCRVYYLPLFWRKLFAMRLPRNNFNHVLQNEAV